MRPLNMRRALLLATCLPWLTPAPAATPGDEVPVDGTLRNLTLPGLNGATKKLQDFRGKPLIINVWASWCGPCRAEMGSLDRLAGHYGKQLAVIGISTDDYPERASHFLQRSGTALPMYIDSPPWPLEHMLGANRLPLTVLVDADGRVVDKYYGAREWDSPAAIGVIGRAFGLKP